SPRHGFFRYHSVAGVAETSRTHRALLHRKLAFGQGYAEGGLHSTERVHRGDGGNSKHAALGAFQASGFPAARPAGRLAEVHRREDEAGGQARAGAGGLERARNSLWRRESVEWISDAAVQR